jgi:hypothetical protein
LLLDGKLLIDAVKKHQEALAFPLMEAAAKNMFQLNITHLPEMNRKAELLGLL